MKRTVFHIFTLSFALGMALPSAAEAPRPATQSSKSSPTIVRPVAGSKPSSTNVTEQIHSVLRKQPGLRHPQSAGGAVTGVTLSWSSMSGGGLVEGTVPGSRLSGSAGQSVVVQGTNSNFALSGGFWYGAQGCDCPAQFDLDGDGFTDSTDLSLLIDEVFFSGPWTRDPNCTLRRGDADCNGFTDSTDLAIMIDMVFFGGPGPCNPCF